jgi:NAD(P)-dependent dehydrogenase (short-subunit alcohol dehydrogenase family)
VLSVERPTVSVVTGAAGAIGLACARRLADRGIVLLSDVEEERLRSAATELEKGGHRVEIILTDVTSEDSVAELAKRAGELGKLGGVVHAAGLPPQLDDWRLILRVNLVGTALVTRALLPLAAIGTVCVCIASIAGHRQVAPEVEAILADPLAPGLLEALEPYMGEEPGRDAYGFSKVGVRMLCRRQVLDWAGRRARIVSISPGVIDTRMGRLAMAENPGLPDRVARSPLRRIGSPDEIAAAAAFLTSREASFITGCDLLVDAGITAALWDS